MMQADAPPQIPRVLPAILHYFSLLIGGLLLGYIALLPFTPLRLIERNSFIVLLGALALWCLFNRKLFYVPTPFDLRLLAFLLWIGLTLPFAVSPQYSVQEYGKLLQQVMMFYAVGYFLKENQLQRILFCLIGGVAIVVAGYGVTQFNLTNGQAVKSFFTSEVWLTTFLVMVFPFAFAVAFGNGPREVKGMAAIACGLFFACLLGTQSRAGLVSFLAELWIMAWLLRSSKVRIAAGGITLFLILAVLIAFKVDFSKNADPLRAARESLPIQTNVISIFHRFDIWAFTLTEIVRHGIVGIGYGSHSYLLTYGEDQESVSEGHQPVKRAGTHNIFLYFALHVGLPGAILFGWLYYTFIVRTIREYRQAAGWMQQAILAGSAGSLLGLLCRLQFDQMLIGTLAILFWVLLAMAVLQYPSVKTGPKSSLV
ncbi:MAG TPA: O-antigen ligase family protein [Nitrospira sp.]